VKSLLPAESFVQNIDRYFIVDVRSPGEFTESHIPRAVNVPLFTDEERAVVGTTYWQEGTDRAKLVGLSLVSPRLPKMVEGILKEAAGRDIVLYCWRGGMRSRSVFTVMEALGYPVWQLIGGFKAFRRLVVNYFKDAKIHMPVFVLNGLTGVGKTLVLNELHTLGAPVLDLEGMANHRGSAFGAVGLGNPRSQKDFDALLYLALRRLEQVPYLIVEGEGKKIGPVILPDFLYDAMQKGPHILLEASLDVRVERILQEYHGILDNTKELATAVLSLQKRLGRTTCEGLAEQILQGEFASVAKKLCTDYYDLYYRDSRKNKTEYLAVINVDDLQAGAREIFSLAKGSVREGRSNDDTV
jgi:tRNA 2-selenouridine synthase